MQYDTSSFTAPTLLESTWRALAWPHKAFNFWFAAAFIVLAVQVFLASGFNLGVILFLFLPPGFALAARNNATCLPTTRFLASLLLILLSFGDVFALIGAHYGWRPNPSLSPWTGLMYDWYCFALLGFTLLILPPFLFIRPILQRRRREKPYFSMFTCYLGLFAWILVVAIVIFGFVGNTPLHQSMHGAFAHQSRPVPPNHL